MTQKRTLSKFHLARRKKQSKKECPGCGQRFTDWYFETHKNERFKNNVWACHQDFKASSYNFLDKGEVQTSSSDDGIKKVSDIFSNFIHRKYKTSTQCGESYNIHVDDDSDCDNEIWTNIQISDIDLDLNIEKDGACSSNDINMGSNTKINVSVGALLAWICIFICIWQSTNMIPDSCINTLLSFLSTFFKVLGEEYVAFSSISAIFPCSVYLLWKKLGLKKDNFCKYVICRKCFCLYEYEKCILHLEGEKVSATCSFVPFPNHTQQARRVRCGETLLKTVILSNGKKQLYPFKTYCYKSVVDSLKNFVQRPGFEDMCEKWRSRESQPGYLTDVYDGKVWKEFHEESKKCFLKHPRNYGLMLNLDWFQPFEHVRYSVGVMYAVILNLPREERFKLKNVFLIGIIPDMNGEPSVNTFVKPLVDELKQGWEEGFQLVTHKRPKEGTTFKIALMCVGCDIPATRKLCGFLGHNAFYGCSKCMKKFPGGVGNKDYSGFECQSWEPRTLDKHREHVGIVQNAKTSTERDKLESTYGLRYSPLIELEYFDPIRMSIIDPMHNLFQGTAKMMVKLWIDNKILVHDHLKKIQEKVDAVDTASNIGKIPRKIASSFGGFTAEQWKNWTIIFSIFALKDILPRQDLEIFRNFVLACQVIVTKIVSYADIHIFHNNMIKFCSEFEEKYGKTKVTPNMHLHCHLADCVKDYGPVYSFWLFSFERYNGHLGDIPNNNRSIEMQLMRRFTRDAFVNSLSFPDVHEKRFEKHMSSLHCSDVKETCLLSELDLLKVLMLSKKSIPVNNQNWQLTDAYSIPKTSCHTLLPDDVYFLKKTYLHLYPNLGNAINEMPESYRSCTVVYLGKEVYGSWQSRHKRSSYIMAYWHAVDASIQLSDGNLTPGIIEHFVLHNLIVGDESRVHLFAKVKWLMPLTHIYKYHCGKPIEAWSCDAFDVYGESAFLPIQRIYHKFVRADGKIFNKKVCFVCPVTKGISV